MEGTYAQKSKSRAQAIVAASGLGAGDAVAVLGAVHDIVEACLMRDAAVEVSDLGQAGAKLLGVEVTADWEGILRRCDLAIVTGNVLKTETLSEVLTVGRTKPVVFYAMTGHNIAPHYLEWGASIVVREPFPYYWFAGIPSLIEIFPREADE